MKFHYNDYVIFNSEFYGKHKGRVKSVEHDSDLQCVDTNGKETHFSGCYSYIVIFTIEGTTLTEEFNEEDLEKYE